MTLEDFFNKLQAADCLLAQSCCWPGKSSIPHFSDTDHIFPIFCLILIFRNSDGKFRYLETEIKDPEKASKLDRKVLFSKQLGSPLLWLREMPHGRCVSVALRAPSATHNTTYFRTPAPLPSSSPSLTCTRCVSARFFSALCGMSFWFICSMTQLRRCWSWSLVK